MNEMDIDAAAIHRPQGADHQDAPAPAGNAAPAGEPSDDPRTEALVGAFMESFDALARLGELSEDMRILSLNAELAAGRAGRAGVAVRALTQYTRQLVSQLNRLQEEMADLKSAISSGRRGAPGEAMAFAGMSEKVKTLAGYIQTVRRVAEQSNGISTNIAIEAAAAGRHESEFRTVADTMKRYIADLRAMVDEAERSVKKANELTMGRS